MNWKERLLRYGQRNNLALKLPQRKSGYVHWLGIYYFKLWDLNRSRMKARGINIPEGIDMAFHIRIFSVPESYDESYWLGESDCSDKESYYFFSIEDVEKKLIDLGINTDELEPQGNTEYPI